MVLKLLSFILLLTAPHLVWGFSFENIESYKKQALNLKLDESPAWLRLGHYRKSLTGGHYSPIQGNFFLAANGINNPRSELLATIDHLFSEKTASSQCRYLARTSWLKNNLNISSADLLPCPERDIWKKNLGATEVYLIFAASDLSSAPSSFGHTFLRLHNPKNVGQLDLLDYGINYAAVTGTDGGALYALKGVLGYYPATYSMLPYHQKIQEYSNLEGRDLWEYRMKLSPDQVELMVNHLLELEGSYAPYYFADENCSAQLLELIEVASPQSQLTNKFHDIVIPLDTVKVLDEAGLLENERVRSSLQTEWRARYGNLNLAERAALKEILNSKKTGEKYNALTKKEKAEALEASLSYLSIKEYRDHKEYKSEKYELSVARARLGALTEPVTIIQPKSPLLSPPTAAFYLGYGQDDKVDFYQFKFRRGFHDLLSDDSGLALFSQLEFFSFDLRYRPTQQNWDLYQFVALSILSTSPWTQLEKPLTWKIDVGTKPKFMPYVNGGIGASFDLPFAQTTRWSWLAISENTDLTETARPYLGAESLFMTKWSEHFRTVLEAAYLYSTSEGRSLGRGSIGMSFDHKKIEYRLEAERFDQEDRWKASIVF